MIGNVPFTNYVESAKTGDSAYGDLQLELFKCPDCAYIYNEFVEGFDHSFNKLASDWVCPDCGAAKAGFTVMPYWFGRVSFSKPNDTDGSDPLHQDLVTPNVKLTRGNSGGFYNVFEESSFDQNTSPALTEWAIEGMNGNPTGDDFSIANISGLTFSNWRAAHGNNAPAQVAKRAFMKDTTSNIIVEFYVTYWQSGGGGFAYDRGQGRLS